MKVKLTVDEACELHDLLVAEWMKEGEPTEGSLKHDILGKIEHEMQKTIAEARSVIGAWEAITID
jgi:hypothetical protein